MFFNHPTLLTAPAANDTIVDLADVKDHARVFFSDDDAYLTGLILAAQSYIEGWQGWLGRCLLDQVWTQDFECWLDRYEAPFPDLIAAVVKYQDVNGDEQTVSSSEYWTVAEFICFKTSFTFPTLEDENPSPVTIEWQHGVTTIPEDVKLAIKMLIAHWYENREAIVPNERRIEFNATPMAFQAIMAKYRTHFGV